MKQILTYTSIVFLSFSAGTIFPLEELIFRQDTETQEFSPDNASIIASAYSIAQKKYPEMLNNGAVFSITYGSSRQVQLFYPNQMSAVVTFEFDNNGNIQNIRAVK